MRLVAQETLTLAYFRLSCSTRQAATLSLLHSLVTLRRPQIWLRRKLRLDPCLPVSSPHDLIVLIFGSEYKL